MERACIVAVVFACASVSATARAAPESEAERSEAPFEQEDLRVHAGLGMFRGQTIDEGLVASLTATFRYGLWQGGIFGEFGTEVLGGNYKLFAGGFGPALQMDDGWRYELLGFFGHRDYEGVGCRPPLCSGGASAGMPWLGARAGISYVSGRSRRGHFELGLAMTFGTDLERRRVEYTACVLDPFGDGERSCSQSSATLGGAGGSLVLLLGGHLEIVR